MKSLILALFTILFFQFATLKAFAEEENIFNILHISDINGNIDSIFTKSPEDKIMEAGGFARIAYFVKSFKELHANTFFVSAGDIIAPMPWSSRTKGKLTIELMNHSLLDVWTVGNYDFLYGLEELKKRISEANFEVISTNLYLKSTNKPWLKPYVILEKGSKKIAFLGVTSFLYLNNVPEEVQKTLEVKSPFETVKEASEKLKKEVDLVVLIAQLNNEAKTEILNKTKVDMIVGGIELYKESEVMSFRTRNDKISAITTGYGSTIGEISIDLSNKPSFKKVSETFLDFEKYPQSLLNDKVKNTVELIEDYKKAIKDEVITTFDRSPTLEESQKFIANVLRNSTNSDLSILRNSFFLRRAKLYVDITKERIFTIVHLPIKGAKIRISGADLKAFLNSVNQNDFVFSGLEGNLINKVTINNSEKYFLVTDEVLAKNNLILRERGTITYTKENINETVLAFVKKHKGKVINFKELEIYESWKTGFNLDLDPQFLGLEVPKEGKYNYLTWRSDQNATRWGGLFTGFLRRYWDNNQFENTLEAEFRQQQAGKDPIRVYADRLKFTSTYNRTIIPDYLTPFAEARVSTLFTNPDPKKNYLLFGQLITGLSHNLPFGIKIREGLEVRKNFLENTLPWLYGGSFGLQFNNSFYLFRESLDTKVFVPVNFFSMITELENRLSCQIGFLNIFYKLNLYNESSDLKNWAIRHNVGIGLNLDNSFAF